MSNYIRKINTKYISNFKTRVRDRILGLFVSSDTQYLKIVLSEIDRLFRIISGRQSSKSNIPKPTDYPNSTKYNSFIHDISIDIEKLYSSQDLINDDVQNVMNFNSLEREKNIRSLSVIQKAVYSSYIVSQKNLTGNIVIKENFIDEKLNSDCSNVEINLNNEILTLKPLSSTFSTSNIDTSMVNCFNVNQFDSSFNIYPNSSSLALGSFWKKDRTGDIHWSLKDDQVGYRSMMIDGSNPNNVGSCQFEMVATFNQSTSGSDSRTRVSEKLSKILQLHTSYIMVDASNSLFGRYVNNNDPNEMSIPKIKLSIPLINTPSANGLLIDFSQNDSGMLPTILFDESYVYDLSGNKKRFVSLDKAKLDEYNKTGRFMLYFQEGVCSPTKIELILTYSSGAWSDISHWMSCYNFSYSQDLLLGTNSVDGSSIKSRISKILYVFVDSETNTKNEIDRVIKVLTHKEVNK